MKYFMLICYSCGHAQAKSTLEVTSAVFKCNMCGKTRKLKYSRKYGLQLKGVETPNMEKAVGMAIDYNGKDKDEKGTFRTANLL